MAFVTISLAPLGVRNAEYWVAARSVESEPAILQEVRAGLGAKDLTHPPAHRLLIRRLDICVLAYFPPEEATSK